MKQILTSSWKVWIIEYDNKKVVKKLQMKRNELHGYPRTMPIKKIMKLLENTGIKYPKILKSTLKYTYEEFIEKDDTVYEHLQIIDELTKYMAVMFNVDYSSVKKYLKWDNNEEYYSYLIQNMKTNIKNFENKTLNVLNALKIGNEFNKVQELKLKNDYKMSFIHGDIKRENVIINKNGMYIIDWETATVADIAYEVALNFLLMKYNENEKEYFLESLLKKIDINRESLVSNMYVYYYFELVRRTYLKLDKIIKKERIDNINIDNFYNDYKKLCDIAEIEAIRKEELVEVIKEK